jgi:hypothetical protein
LVSANSTTFIINSWIYSRNIFISKNGGICHFDHPQVCAKLGGATQNFSSFKTLLFL